MLELEEHGPDTFVGSGPQYPWGGLYGGQIVAQALRAATLTVDPEYLPHSIRAYFIRRGDHLQPVRYEVERIRDGRSFLTRRVVARQAVGAILNAECSFQRPEQAPLVQTVRMPAVPPPDGIENTSFSEYFDRRDVSPAALVGSSPDGEGRSAAWIRTTGLAAAEVGADELATSRRSVLNECWLTFVSDDLPTLTVFNVLAAHGNGQPDQGGGMSASLDHTVWFHRPMQADSWHLYDMTCHHVGGARGLAFGHVFASDGEHVASFAQEVLARLPRG